MQTDGQHLFLWEYDSVRAFPLKTQCKPILMEHGHIITLVHICQGFLWTVCKEKVVQWDLETLQKQKEWKCDHCIGIFEYHDQVVVAQSKKAFLFGQEEPWFETKDTEIKYISTRYIVVSKNSSFSLYMDKELYMTPQVCQGMIMGKDHMVVLKNNLVECWDLRSLSYWHMKKMGNYYRFSPNDKFLLIKAFDAQNALIVCTQTGTRLQKLQLESPLIWHPNSQKVIVASLPILSITIRPYQQQKSAEIPSSFFQRWMLKFF